MPNKTLYVQPTDINLWERAAELAPNGNISAFVTAALRSEIRRREAAVTDVESKKGFELLQVEVGTETSGKVKKSFVGRWLVKDESDDDFVPSWSGGDVFVHAWTGSVALTRKGELIVWSEDMDWDELDDDYRADVRILHNLEELSQLAKDGVISGRLVELTAVALNEAIDLDR